MKITQRKLSRAPTTPVAFAVLTLALALDKPVTKRILTYHDLPTPSFQVFERVGPAAR